MAYQICERYKTLGVKVNLEANEAVNGELDNTNGNITKFLKF